MRVLPTRKRQPEVIEPMLEAFTGDRDAEIAHIGEVGQPDLARHRLLTEDDLSLGAVQRPPVPDPSFQRASNAGVDFGMSTKDFLEKGDRPQPGATWSIGTISLSQTAASGSGRRRWRGLRRCDARRDRARTGNRLPG
jgi:hypothetical protein